MSGWRRYRYGSGRLILVWGLLCSFMHQGDGCFGAQRKRFGLKQRVLAGNFYSGKRQKSRFLRAVPYLNEMKEPFPARNPIFE